MPSTPHRRARLLASLIAIAFVAAACGSTAPSSTNEPGAVSDAPAPEASSAPEESPIADLLGIPIGDDAADEYFGELQRQAEVKVAECMLVQGFEYTPVGYDDIETATANIAEDSRDFAENYGFGIASNPWEEAFEAFDPASDPNLTYQQSLSPAEQDAYQQALYGEIPEPENGETVIEVNDLGGCQGEAFNDVFAIGEVFDQFGDEFSQMEEAIESDSRIVAATSGWSSCMAEAGYGFTDRDGARREIERRYNEIVRDPEAFADPFANQGGGIAGTDDEGDQGSEAIVVFGPQSLNPQFQARVDDLAVEEREIATASWDCEGELRAIEQDVRVEYERRFVAEHGERITAALGA